MLFARPGVLDFLLEDGERGFAGADVERGEVLESGEFGRIRFDAFVGRAMLCGLVGAVEVLVLCGAALACAMATFADSGGSVADWCGEGAVGI